VGIAERIGELIRQQVAEGRQIGLQVCVYHEGRVVVDDCAGQMGPADARPVEPNTLFCCFSSTKGVAALAVHMLADRGMLDYDAPVAKYWPAFGQHGKDRVTVAQAMSHQAGLHAMPEPFAVEHLTDFAAGMRRMEQGVPAYEPGTATGYHAVTFAWVAGGIVLGASGRHIKDFVRDEIARPLGVEDEFHIGIPREMPDERLATLEIVPAGEGLDLAPDSDFYKAMPKEQWPHFNSRPVREACLPSGNGHFSARALARMYAALAGDGSIDGVRLVSADRIPHMQRLMTSEPDRVILAPINKGIGFFFGGETGGVHGPMGRRSTAFGHPGAGGSVGFCDPEASLAVGLTINKMQYPAPGTGTTLEICDAIRAELGVA
jgi:CubicO group peptidase (beta-lactamase class C family)